MDSRDDDTSNGYCAEVVDDRLRRGWLTLGFNFLCYFGLEDVNSMKVSPHPSLHVDDRKVSNVVEA